MDAGWTRERANDARDASATNDGRRDARRWTRDEGRGRNGGVARARVPRDDDAGDIRGRGVRREGGVEREREDREGLWTVVDDDAGGADRSRGGARGESGRDARERVGVLLHFSRVGAM